MLVPTYQRPAFLLETLGGLASHAPDDTEVWVLNDGGPPITLTGVQVLNLAHGGQAGALNAGLGHARGELIAVVHDDDTVLPGGLAALREGLLAHPEAVAAYSLPQYTDERGTPIETPPALRAFLLAHPVLTWTDVQRDGLMVHGGGILYRRAALRAIHGWDSTLQTAEEYDLHLRLLHRGGVFAAVDAVTVTYRRHPGGKSQDRVKRRALRAGVMARIYAKLTDAA